MRFRVPVLIAAVISSAISGAITPTAAIAAPAPAQCTDRAADGPVVGYALTADQRLVCFKVSRPSSMTVLLGTRALAGADTALVGIDTRPATGAIWALGNAGGLYVLDPAVGRPELKARLNVALEGTNFGLDFNPTVDRLRVVSDTGQNLRINVDTGATTVDAFLRTGTVRALGVGAVAYTNNDNDASTATTLFDIDAVGDRLVTQAPPNDGVLAGGSSLGFAGTPIAAFDIWSDIQGGKAVANMGFASLDGGAFFRVDLDRSSLRYVGNFSLPVIGLTFPTA